MQVIGFNIRKIKAEREDAVKRGNINTNMEFTDVSLDKVPALKDDSAIRVSFKFEVEYALPDKDKDDKGKQAEILIEGSILLSGSDSEIKDITTAWKDKKIPVDVRVPLINLILKKCSTKALLLEDDLNLSPHIKLPTVQKEKKKEE